MDRREALKGMVATASGLLFPRATLGSQEKPLSEMMQDGKFGWHHDQKSLEDFVRRHRYPFITQQNRSIKGSGNGKKAFLHLAFERVTGRKYQPHNQGAPDCVSHAYGLGVDFLACVQIAIQRMPQRWIAEVATEIIYGGARVEIGGYRGIGGGATGHWGAEWLQEYGVLLRQSYPGGFDYTTYDPRKAVEYGRTGCPDSLEHLAKLHPVKKTAICRSYEDLCDCIYNGSPVIVCSNVGFGGKQCTRDNDGFLRRRRKPWFHAMLFGGYDDEFRRPGALCFNSWGDNWISGGSREIQPAGTFWVDSSTVDSMLRQGDSFAISAFRGFPRIDIPPYILY